MSSALLWFNLLNTYVFKMERLYFFQFWATWVLLGINALGWCCNSELLYYLENEPYFACTTGAFVARKNGEGRKDETDVMFGKSGMRGTTKKTLSVPNRKQIHDHTHTGRLLQTLRYCIDCGGGGGDDDDDDDDDDLA